MKNAFILLSLVSLFLFASCNKEQSEQTLSIYTCESFQSGENAPVMNIFENTIGPIVWEYVSEGVYHGTLNGAFHDGKTFIVCNNGVDGFISADVRNYSEDFIELRTFAGLNDLGEPKLSNGCSGVSFEIRVYN